eukprot:NODE_1203_length_1802_cov_0.487375.p1 type:complete len:274 gc:universal NODE_1203_length_1802_cov_0.487375:1136-315(-)
MAIRNPFKFAQYKQLPFKTLWRRVLAEFIGTTLFIYVVSASAVIPSAYLTDEKGVSDLITAFIQGFGLIAIVSIFAGISGGHFNPAVTVALTITRSIAPMTCVLYIIAQIFGGLLGAAFFRGSVDDYQNLSATTLNPLISNGQGFLIEFMITNILLFVVVSTTADEENGLVQLAPVPIGLSVLVGVLIAKNLTGASMNPARSFGTSAISNTWDNHWVYWIAPLFSALVVGVLYKSIFFTDPDKSEGYEQQYGESKEQDHVDQMQSGHSREITQ